MSEFDEPLLDDPARLAARDEHRLLWALAGAGAQVRRAEELRAEFGLDQLSGARPRCVLLAADAPSRAALWVLERLGLAGAPTLAWHGPELPGWAGAADALLVGAIDGRHPRLAGLVEQATRRGLALAVAAPAGSPVGLAAGRAAVHELPAGLAPTAALWAVLTPLLQALDALAIAPLPAGTLAQVADALDAMAETCRPDSSAFTNPAKGLAIEFAESDPVIAGAGNLAGVAARVMAEAIQLRAGVGAVAVGLPDGVARAGALLRGAGPAPVEDFFRDRIEADAARRARLLVIGDDGSPLDPELGPRSEARVQLDEVAARRAAQALHELARGLGLRTSSLAEPTGPALARFAAAGSFGEFTAAYLALGLGLDPGGNRPAELAH